MNATHAKSNTVKRMSGEAAAEVALRMVDMLDGNPFATRRGAEQQLGLAYNTVMRAIGQLEKRGIVKEVSGANVTGLIACKKYWTFSKNRRGFCLPNTSD